MHHKPQPILHLLTPMAECKKDDEKLTIYYHGGFSGRAQPLDMMCEFAGAPWERKSRADCTDPTVFAVPAVKKGDRVLSQTTACAAWLGDELGLAPADALKFEAMKLGGDIADIWSEAYSARKSAKSWEAASEFIGGRLAKYFSAVEATVVKHNGGGDYCLGSSPCYVDFLLLNALNVCKFMFGDERFAPALAGAPTVAAIGGRLWANDKVAKCMAAEPVGYQSISAEGGKMPL